MTPPRPNRPQRLVARRSVRSGVRAVAVAVTLVVGLWSGATAPTLAASAAPVQDATSTADVTPSPEAATGAPAASEKPSAQPSPSGEPEPSSTSDPSTAGTPGTQAAGDDAAAVEPSPSPSETTETPGAPGASETPEVTEAPEATADGPDAARAMARADVSLLATGIPEAPRQVWSETFEQNLANVATGLPAYASGRYTASSGWVNGTSCTGVLVNYLATYPNAAFCPSQGTVATPTTVSAREVRRLADVLGQVAAGVVGGSAANSPANGSTASGTRTNHALVAYPNAAVTGGTTVLQSVNPLGVTAPDRRFYQVRMNAAGAVCGTNNASLQLTLFTGTTTLLTGYAAPVVPCAATGSVFYTSPTLTASGGVLDPAWSTSARAATYNGTTATALTPAQVASARVQLVNTVTGAGSAFGVDDLRLLDVTPALDVAFTSGEVTATVPTTLTYTITNTSDLLAKTDWGFSTALPTGLVVAPTPAVAGTCTNVAGTAYAVTATAGASGIDVVGGDLAAAATSCTITVSVVAGAAGTFGSGTVTPSGLVVASDDSLVVVPATTITIRKNLPARAAAGDQFTLSLRQGTTVLASATTSGTATGLQAGEVTRAVVQPGAVYTIHEAQTAGAGLGYAPSYECTRAGTVIASGAGGSGSLTVPDEQGAEVVCTFTNTVQTARLFCDANHFYSVTPAGVLQQGDIVTGAAVTVGTWPSVTSANALGVGTGGTVAYALDRTSAANGVVSILKWSTTGGFQKIPDSAYTLRAGGTTISGSIVAGAVDTVSGRFLFGTFVNSRYYLWSFTESNPVATRFAFVGAFPTGATPNGNGDMAFDGQGNLYVVGAATVNNAGSATIYTVTAATLASASGGTLAVGSSTTRALVGTDAAFANVNGIAFSPRGTVYLANAGSAYEFDSTTWTRVPGTPRVPVDSVDLGGCSSPSTITVQKNVVGRLAAADQFTLTASTGTPSTAFATATTTGATTGRQAAQIGPLPAPTGTTINVSEAMATGSTSAIGAYTSIYECWSDGVRLSTGTGASGSVVMPNRLSANVTCTFFNSPRRASTVRITKVIREFSGLERPGVGFSVGTTATASAGTATALPSEAPRQPTDAAGQASWSVLYGSTVSVATIVVSEVQQTGFAFVSGSCTVNGAARAATFTQTGTVISASLTGIGAATAVECRFVNAPTASLTLVKSVSFGSALTTDWTLSATGPAAALPGPSGRSGAAGTSNVPVTPGVPYRLAESGGTLTYVQTGGWVCRTAAGATLEVSAAGDVVPTSGSPVTCTVTNATATITLLNQVQDPRAGFQAPDWRVTATPGAVAGGVLPTETRLGAEYVATGNPTNTFEVRPGHGYTLTQAATDPRRPLAYQELRLERLVGSTWTPVTSRTITAPAAGQTAVYRFVNAPVGPTTLPLTGGTGADTFSIAGGAVLIVALLLSVWHGRRRRRGAFR